MTRPRKTFHLPRETWLLAMAAPLLGFASEVMLFPQMWRLSAQSEAVNFLVALALACAIHAAARSFPRLWLALAAAGVAGAAMIQSLAEIRVMTLAARNGANIGVDGYALPATAEAVRMMLAIRIQGNLLEFGFFAAAISLILIQRSALEARLRSQSAELEVLRLQLAPHFLLNAFSSLQTLIETDRRPDAARMVSNLSGFFRSVLLSSVQRSVSLEQEIENLQDYLAVEQTRYGDRLAVAIDLAPAAAQAMVPPLLLQPLAENVVHHVVAHSTRPVTLRIAAAASADGELEIRVSNTIPQDWRPVHEGAGVGQKNVAERLFLTYGDRASLDAAVGPASYEAVIRIRGSAQRHRPPLGMGAWFGPGRQVVESSRSGRPVSGLGQ